MQKFLQSKFFDFFVICIRFLFVFTFVSYGYGKLTDSQFGLNPEFLSKPIQELSLYQIGWYLFAHQPFKYVIGISQIVCALLIVFNRTVILGILMFIVITFNILIIDETIMPDAMRLPFRFRLVSYILLAFVVLYHHRNRFIPGLKILLEKYNSNFLYKFWWFLLVPFGVVAIELISASFLVIYRLITDYDVYMESFNSINFKAYFSKLLK